METISVGFSYHNNNLLSKTIQLVEGSNFSHVYIRRKSKYGEYVYQSSGLAVNFTNINIFLAHNTIVEEYEFDLSDDKKDKLITFFIKYVGAGYELSSLFKLLAMIAGKRAGINIKFEGKDDEFICSELAALFCRDVLDIPVPSDIDFITPKMLNPIVQQYGRRVI